MNKLFAFFLLFSCFEKTWGQESYGLMMIVKGQVQVVRQKEQPVNSRVGDKVYPEDTIITGKDSRTKIVMNDRNIINVLPETKIRIDQYINNRKEKNVRLSLFEGKVRTNVEQKYDNNENKFEIKTPTAVAGVRGTQFVTGFLKMNNTTTVTTLRGEVVFRGYDKFSKKQTEAVLVKRGEVAENSEGQKPSSAVKINPTEMKRIETETAVRKNFNNDKQIFETRRNEVSPIFSILNSNDNLLGDSVKNIINKPATVNIVIQQ